MSRKLSDPYFVASHHVLEGLTEKTADGKPITPGYYWGNEMSPVHGPFNTRAEAQAACEVAVKAGEI